MAVETNHESVSRIGISDATAANPRQVDAAPRGPIARYQAAGDGTRMRQRQTAENAEERAQFVFSAQPRSFAIADRERGAHSVPEYYRGIRPDVPIGSECHDKRSHHGGDCAKVRSQVQTPLHPPTAVLVQF